MCSLEIDQQCFLINLFSPTPLIPKATQIQYDEGDSRLSLRLAIAEYCIPDQNLKKNNLAQRYSIRHFTLQRYAEVVIVSGTQYKRSRMTKQ